MTNFAPAFYCPNLFGVFRRVRSVWDVLHGSLFARLLAFAGLPLCAGELSLEVSLFFRAEQLFGNSVLPRRAARAFVFALFALRRCWIFVGLPFVDRACHSNAFLLVFDSASAFRGEKRRRQTHGAENSVGGASRFDADARAPSRQVFATKTRSRENASEHRKPTCSASRSDSLKTRRANPSRSRGKTRCCDMLELQQSLGRHPQRRSRYCKQYSPRRYFCSVCKHQQKPA